CGGRGAAITPKHPLGADLLVAGPAMPPNKESPGNPSSPAALICLPPISEDMQLVWTQASQTSELDGHQPLRQAFSYFPYPSLADLALLCLRHGLQLEKVKAWFMAQRLRCGISWSAEEIEETRARLACRQDRPAFGALLAPGDPLPQTGKAPGGREAPAAAHHKAKPEESPGSCSAVARGPPEPGRASTVPHHKAKETLTPPPSLFPTPPPPCWAWADSPAGVSHPDTAWDLSKPCRLGAADTAPPSSGATVNGAEAWARPGHPHSTLEAQRQRKSRRKSKEQLAVLKSFFLRSGGATGHTHTHILQGLDLPAGGARGHTHPTGPGPTSTGCRDTHTPHKAWLHQQGAQGDTHTHTLQGLALPAGGTGGHTL
uniref:Homeobox and leucine zipper encoding n=1 Tax=Chelonoidis abingdonii TaxID=106734 RepID=A0A8C0IK43_CHEAB